MDDEPERSGMRDRGDQRVEFARDRGGITRFGVRAGVQFDGVGAGAFRGVDLQRVGIDEERGLDAAGTAARDRIADRGFVAQHVEPALGGQLGALLRHQGDLIGVHRERDPDHLVGDRHLEIQPRLHRLAQNLDVAILDVTPILAQVNGDTGSAGEFGEHGGVHRIGFRGAARLAHGGDVVDVDLESGHGWFRARRYGSASARQYSASPIRSEHEPFPMKNRDDHAPRILGGTWKGRKLMVASGRITRPLKAMARRSLFDSLQPLIPGARVLDLFAGAGTVGFEAASRGASRVVMVEAGAPALRALRSSLETLRCADLVEVVAADAVVWTRGAPEAAFDLIYVGPPYPFFTGEARPTLFTLLSQLPRLLAPGGRLVLETPSSEPSPELGTPLVDRREYGESTLHHYQREEA